MSAPTPLQPDAGAFVAALRPLVEAESPSADAEALAACAAVVDRLGSDLLGSAAETLLVDGVPHLRWSFGATPRVLVLGHYDTVWPRGTLAERPFAVRGERATGPGCFDMKAGIVQAFHAIAAQADRSGVTLLLTGDEETGSRTSRALVEASAAGCDAVLVLEPSADGALKTSRKGACTYRLDVRGRAAHAGLEPERGANALAALARVVSALEQTVAGLDGATIAATMAGAGRTINTVPDRAWAVLDARTITLAQQTEIDARLSALDPGVPGTRLSVTVEGTRPPLEAASSAALLELAREVARELGIGPLEGRAVGGGSDGNFTAAAGIPTLDGLGPVGGGAHAEDEHVLLEATVRRGALVAGLLAELLAGDGRRLTRRTSVQDTPDNGDNEAEEPGA